VAAGSANSCEAFDNSLIMPLVVDSSSTARNANSSSNSRDLSSFEA
jgi:hypothetical protein